MNGLSTRIRDTADWFLARNYSVIPIVVSDNPEHDKKPAVTWMENIENPLKKWRWSSCNIALLTGQFNGVVVADCDSEASYTGWLATKPPTPLRVRTKRGMQFYYRHPGIYIKSGSKLSDPAGFTYDVKGDRSYVLFPPSVRGGHQYQFCVCENNIAGRWIPFDRLPMFDPAWRPETTVKPAELPKLSSNGRPAGAIANGVAYISHIRATGKALGGDGRNNESFRAACKLIESGMSEEQAFQAMQDWNATNCNPPLPVGELVHKVQSALKMVMK